MNREIEFRGKSENGRWYYGYYTVDAYGRAHIDQYDGNQIYSVKVIPETVGQYIGARGKAGRKLYEGDIVTAMSEGYKGTFEIKWRHGGAPCWLLYPAWQNREFWHIHASEYQKGKKFIDVTGKITICDRDGFFDDGIEVIGNIHDNPELRPASSTLPSANHPIS